MISDAVCFRLYADVGGALIVVGAGTLLYPDGGKYDGDIVDGQRHGLGCRTWSGPRVQGAYLGEWVDGKSIHC